MLFIANPFINTLLLLGVSVTLDQKFIAKNPIFNNLRLVSPHISTHRCSIVIIVHISEIIFVNFNQNLCIVDVPKKYYC